MTLRRLDLHVSALNDAEYSLYTSSLADITLTDEQDAKGQDDAFYEEMTLSLREARAWLKGRYSHVPAAVIDNILRFFSPNLSQTDILSGGQFFAALRLIVHAESGKEVDRGLAFVQAHPSTGPVARPASPFKRNLPPTPSRRSTDGVLPTSANPESALQNPFTAPPQHPSSNNPFTVGRAKSNPGVPPSSKSHDGAVESTSSKLPPLPPRKPASSTTLPPPRHSSLASTSPTLITSKSGPHQTSPPPAVPPKPSHMAHVTSTLMKQSLQASKTGQTMKKAEEQLERERVLQVLKSSASTSSSPFSQASSSTSRSISPGKRLASSASTSSASGSERDYSQAPPLPSRRKPSPPTSTSSFQQVALAGTTSSSNPFIRSPFISSQDVKYPMVTDSPSTSPTRKNAPLPVTPNTPNLPPPKHPDQSYRKPPPPIPTGLEMESSDSQRHKRTPSYSRPQALRSATTATSGPFELADTTTTMGSKSASPYISAFDRMTSDSTDTTPTGTPMRRGMSGEESPTARLFRSKSLHHPSPTSSASPFSPVEDSSNRNAPPPPVRKKRPESVQVLPGSPGLGLGNSPGGSGATRHMSMSTSGASSPFGSPSQSFKQQFDAHRREITFPNHDSSKHAHDPLNLKSLAASLQPQFQQIQPKLDKARFKAEAGLSRRGFMVNPNSGKRREDQEGLMQENSMGSEYSRVRHGDRTKAMSDSGVSRWEDNVVYSDSSSDDEAVPNSQSRSWIAGQNGMKGQGATGDPWLSSGQDNLKWPVEAGEGWKRL